MLAIITKMLGCCYVVAFLLALSSSIPVLDASAGDSDQHYRSCLTECGETGCVGGKCFPECTISSNGVPLNHSRNLLEKIYVHWNKGGCQNNCQYHCMLDREEKRASLDHDPVKYHGKWPFKRVYGIEEPGSVAFSSLNLAMHFHGWLSFISFLQNKLPLKVGRKAHYGYACLWHVHGLLALNAFFWSIVSHSRHIELTEKLDFSATVAVLGFSLILAILRCFNIRNEAARVMTSAPFTSFVTTHMLYLNCFKLDYVWHSNICHALAAMQLTIWTIWSVFSQNPSRWKLWLVILGGVAAFVVKGLDFPPYEGLVDSHALSHAVTVPFTCLWWSFARDDAMYLASKRVKRTKMKST